MLSPRLTGAGEAVGLEPCVVTRMAGGRYAFPMAGVTEVGRLCEVTRLPHLPPFVVGVANWRGRLLAVVDVRGLLGQAAPPEFDSAARVVIVGHNGIVTGVLTEQVEGVLDIDLACLQPPPTSASASAVPLLKGQVIDLTGPVSVIDVEAICDLRTSLPGKN